MYLCIFIISSCTTIRFILLCWLKFFSFNSIFIFFIKLSRLSFRNRLIPSRWGLFFTSTVRTLFFICDVVIHSIILFFFDTCIVAFDWGVTAQDRWPLRYHVFGANGLVDIVQDDDTEEGIPSVNFTICVGRVVQLKDIAELGWVSRDLFLFGCT